MFIKNTVSADTNRQIICRVKVRHSYCHDNVDFIPILYAIQNLPISLVVADKGYDDEKNHQFVRECLIADSIIPARLTDIPIWKTHGRYRKQMKRGYSKHLYNQRNKVEAIFSVIKIVWRIHKIKKDKDKESRDGFQVYCLQYAQMCKVVLFIVVWFLHSLSHL